MTSIFRKLRDSIKFFRFWTWTIEWECVVIQSKFIFCFTYKCNSFNSRTEFLQKTSNRSFRDQSVKIFSVKESTLLSRTKLSETYEWQYGPQLEEDILFWLYSQHKKRSFSDCFLLTTASMNDNSYVMHFLLLCDTFHYSVDSLCE